MSKIRVLVGTRKGAFILTSDGKRERWKISDPHFAHTNVVPLATVCCSLLLFFKVFVAVSHLFGLRMQRLFGSLSLIHRKLSIQPQAAPEAVSEEKILRSAHAYELGSAYGDRI